MKRIHALPMLAALLLSGCATTKPPEKYTPKFIYMVLYGGKFRRYPLSLNSGAKEKEVETSEVVGGFCLEPDDWASREKYILDLEAFKGR